ncbi:hypothetical protein SBV1_3390010 [Verrucomicrobia bacterium]|nr:hypothetical protein SBV1_3390010 [Verrucomicrobiota bacterium]
MWMFCEGISEEGLAFRAGARLPSGFVTCSRKPSEFGSSDFVIDPLPSSSVLIKAEFS